jgi:acyl carrier protein
MSAPAITFDAITEYVAEILQVPRERLKPDDLIRDLSTDSLALVELAVDLQEDFDVVITQEEFAQLATLGDLEALLRERQRGDHGGTPKPQPLA